MCVLVSRAIRIFSTCAIEARGGARARKKNTYGPRDYVRM